MQYNDIFGFYIYLFNIALILSMAAGMFSNRLSLMMHASADAFAQTSLYIRICGFGFLFVVAYNVLGGIFRGLGDSQTPLITVAMAFVAQNMGAGRTDRSKKALLYGIISSLLAGSVMAYITVFHGNVLASLFSGEQEVIAAAFDYLKAYGCVLRKNPVCVSDERQGGSNAVSYRTWNSCRFHSADYFVPGNVFCGWET